MKLNDRAALKQLRTKLEALLTTLGSELGVSFNVGTMLFDPTGASCAIKLDVRRVDQKTGLTEDPARTDFKEFAALYGLKPEMLDKTFTSYAGRRYQIVGLKPRSQKYPVLVRKLPGTQLFKMSAEEVLVHIDKGASKTASSASQTTH